MIQKKVCMVGVYGTGKTSLVQRFVHSLFSAKYHSTVGVKVDRKAVQVGDTPVNLLLWDVEGSTADQEIPSSYLRGAHAMFFVADGTRREPHSRWMAKAVPSAIVMSPRLNTFASGSQ